MDLKGILLLVSGLYLLVIFAVLGRLGLKGDLPKFVAVMRLPCPSGCFWVSSICFSLL